MNPRPMLTRLATALACSLVLLAGLPARVAAAPTTSTTTATPAAVRVEGAELQAGQRAERTVAIQPFVADSMQAIRSAQRGRPFVLVLWSVSCVPCREELPHWADWQRRYPDLAIVLVATDPPADTPLVRRALARQADAPAASWAFADDYVERLRWSIDPAWYGEVPRTYLFDATHRATGRSGRLDAAAVERWLQGQSGQAGRGQGDGR